MRVGGIILCGGRSSRMGRPKAWLPVGGEPMLLRTVRVLTAVAYPVVVVTAPGQDVPPLPTGVELACDPVEGNGPLQGLLTGLTVIGDRVETVVVVGCDAPFLTSTFIQRLFSLRGDSAACVPVADGFPHPIPGVYAVGVAADVRAMLAAGQHRLGALLDRVPTRFVDATAFADVDPSLSALRNVNTPDEYAKALADLGQPPDDGGTG